MVCSSIILKSQGLDRVTSQNFFMKQTDMGSIQSLYAAEPWNKIQKQLKDLLFKDLSPRKIKTIASNLYLESY